MVTLPIAIDRFDEIYGVVVLKFRAVKNAHAAAVP
jgi:hypothetical protein